MLLSLKTKMSFASFSTVSPEDETKNKKWRQNIFLQYKNSLHGVTESSARLPCTCPKLSPNEAKGAAINTRMCI
jgi:hypothetical protein